MPGDCQADPQTRDDRNSYPGDYVSWDPLGKISLCEGDSCRGANDGGKPTMAEKCEVWKQSSRRRQSRPEVNAAIENVARRGQPTRSSQQ